MKRFLITLSVLFVVLMFMGTSFVIATDHSNKPLVSGNKSHVNVNPFVHNNNTSSPGYVKYTLDLLNNTLLTGNFVDTGNGLFPFGVAFDSSNGYVYVTNDGSGNVSVINGSTNKVVTSITVGCSPLGVAFDSSNGYVYVTNGGSSNVSVINGSTNKVVTSINVGSIPFGVAFDSSNGYVYVTNFHSGTISIISTNSTSPVTFTETGLPSGSTWDVNITGMTSSGPITGSTYTVSLSNGTYSYIIGTTDKTYHANGGSFTESAGTPSSIPVTFALFTYSVTFTEKGLPSGTHWNLTFNGTKYELTNTSYTFHVVNGTYSYSIANVSGYTISKQTSTTTINGNSMAISITFTASPSGISSIELYGIIGAVIAIAAVSVGIAVMRKRKA
jgi:YVTN family beta-propeller protein